MHISQYQQGSLFGVQTIWLYNDYKGLLYLPPHDHNLKGSFWRQVQILVVKGKLGGQYIAAIENAHIGHLIPLI